jgi:hypothetical protein
MSVMTLINYIMMQDQLSVTYPQAVDCSQTLGQPVSLTHDLTRLIDTPYCSLATSLIAYIPIAVAIKFKCRSITSAVQQHA